MGANDSGNGMESQNKALVGEFIEVFSGGDVDRVLEMMDDEATWWVGGEVDGLSGTKDKDALGEMLRGLAAICEGGAIRLTPVAFTAEGGRVAVETEGHAQLTNGRVYANRNHFLFEVRDGKIQSVREYLDTEHARATFVAP